MKMTKNSTIITTLLGVLTGVAILCVCLFPTLNKTDCTTYAEEGNSYSWTFKPGDVNEDWEINADDLVALNKMLENGKIDLRSMDPRDKTSGMLAADLNQDDWVNSIDYAILSDYLDGKIKRLPVGEMIFFGDNTPTQYKTKFGDVNRDGMINENDLTMLKAAANNETVLDDYAFNNADVNKDRVIDNKDIEIMEWYLAGKVVQLPVRYVKHESWLWGLIKHDEIGYDTYHTTNWNVGIKINTDDIVKPIADGAGAIADGIGNIGNSIKKGCEDIYNGLCDFFGGLFK